MRVCIKSTSGTQWRLLMGVAPHVTCNQHHVIIAAGNYLDLEHLGIACTSLC